MFELLSDSSETLKGSTQEQLDVSKIFCRMFIFFLFIILYIFFIEMISLFSLKYP